MSYNILIGGSAGQGMDTLAAILEKILQKKGYEVFTIRDYMSRVRGGHNFVQVRFGIEKLYSHKDSIDIIVALNDDTIELHKNRLRENGIVLTDEVSSFNNKNIKKLELKKTAVDLGNVKVVGSVAIGAVLKAFDFDESYVKETLSLFFKKESLVDLNYEAVVLGSKISSKHFEIEKGKSKEQILINGNESIALGAIAANCKFYSAYPMTPSTSIMTYIAQKMEEAEIVVEQAEDEIAGINMAIGSSFVGVRSMTGTSGGGFALKVEALGLAAMMEVPLVIAEVQRPGPTTGFPTRTEQSDLKFIISASQGEFPRMVIAVRDPADAFYQTVRAFNLADKYQIPVIILSDQFLADYTTTVEPFDVDKVTREYYIEDDINEEIFLKYKLTDNGVSPRIKPGSIPGKTILVDSDEHDESGHITESADVRIKMTDKRMKKLKYLEQELLEPEVIGENDSEILIVAWGSLYGPVKEAVINLNKDGVKSTALVYGDIWPFPKKEILEKSKKAKYIINVEQNATGQLASIIRETVLIPCTNSILKYNGRPISSEEIVKGIKDIVLEVK